MHAADDKSEMLHVVRARVDELMSECVSLTAELSWQMQNITPWLPVLASCKLLQKHDMEVAAETRYGKLVVVVESMRCLKFVLQWAGMGGVQRRLLFARHWTNCLNFVPSSKG